MKVFNKLAETNSGVVILISCIMCSLVSNLSGLCPDDMKTTCMNIAGILNCVLCLIVFAHLFGMIKKK